MAGNLNEGYASKEWVAFYEPGYTKLTWNLYKWFKYIIRPQVASLWIVLVSLLTITALITAKVDNVNNCPNIQKYNEWQTGDSNVPVMEKLIGLGERKEFTYYSGNQSMTVSNDCVYADFREPHFKTVYSVIQSTMVFMLVMTLSSGLSKYREEIRLFEALTGDIKAMAMLATHLSYDGQKYDLYQPEQKAKSGDANKTEVKLKYRKNVEEQFDKIKLLLAVLAPSARMVLKGTKTQNNKGGTIVNIPYATPERLETVKNYRKILDYEPRVYPFRPFWCFGKKDNDGCSKYCFDFFNWGIITAKTPCIFPCLKSFGLVREYKRAQLKWSDFKRWKIMEEPWRYELKKEFTLDKLDRFKNSTYEFGKNEEKKFKITGHDLLKDLELHKITEIEELRTLREKLNFPREERENPTSNPFVPQKREYVMYKKIKALGDQTGMDLFECVMTVLLDETMKISENNLGFGNDEGSAVMSAIYTKWEQIYGSWGAMSSIKGFAEPILVHLYRCLMLLAYAFMMPYSYIDMISFGEDDDNVIFWCVFLTFIDVSIFAMMWYIAYEIRNPFVDVRCMNGVKPISAQTQKQVVNLIKYQKDYEEMDYRGIINSKENAEVYRGILDEYKVYKPSEQTLTEILKILETHSNNSLKVKLAEILGRGLNVNELKRKLGEELDLTVEQKESLKQLLRIPPRPSGPRTKIAGYQARGLRRRPLMF